MISIVPYLDFQENVKRIPLNIGFNTISVETLFTNIFLHHYEERKNTHNAERRKNRVVLFELMVPFN